MPWPRSSPTTSSSISVARIRWRATTPVSAGCSGSSVRWFEATNGQIELDQQFCLGADGWAAEWEHATLRRNGNDARVPQRVRVPVRRRSHRRDVDVPRRTARRGRGVLRLTAAARWAKLAGMVQAIEDARAACDDRRWGDAWRLWSTRRRRGPRRRRSRPGGNGGLPDRPRRGGLRPLGARPPGLLGRRRGAPGGALRGEARPGLRVQRRPRAAAEAGSIAPPGSWRRPDIDCVEQGYLEYGLGMLRIFEAGDMAGAHAHFVQAGKIGARFAHRELDHARPHRRRPHADLPGRHRRGPGAARRGHGRRSKPASCRPWPPVTPTAP